MRHLKFKKIRVAKINNLNTILGGNNRQTFLLDCMPDTYTCPPKYTEDPNYSTCQHTDLTLAGDLTEGIANTNRCGG